jgi:hypothetical protein
MTKRPAARDRTDLPALSRRVLAEAADLDLIADDVGLLRLWARQSAIEHPTDYALASKLARDVIAAAATKYRLDPKRADDLAAAVAAVLDQIGRQIGLAETPEV